MQRLSCVQARGVLNCVYGGLRNRLLSGDRLQRLRTVLVADCMRILTKKVKVVTRSGFDSLRARFNALITVSSQSEHSKNTARRLSTRKSLLLVGAGCPLRTCDGRRPDRRTRSGGKQSN